MPDDKTPAVEPSAAAPTNVASLSSATKAAWNRGETANGPIKETPAAPDPPKEATSEADPAEIAAEPDTAPKPQEKVQDKPQDKPQPQPRRKQSAEERIAELVAENKRLKAAGERSPDPAPKPAARAEAEPVKPVEAPKRPSPFKWTGTQEEYDAAMDKYDAHQRQQAAHEALTMHAQQQAATDLKTKLDDARARYSDADTRITPAINAIYQDAQIPGAVKAMLEASPVLVDLMYTLGDEGKLAEFVHTAKTNPRQALREIIVLEQLIEQELKGGKPARQAAEAESEPEAEVKEPVVVPVTRAPKPPSEVGGRGAAPEDSLVAAAHAASKGGVARLSRNFKAEADRRYAAKHA